MNEINDASLRKERENDEMFSDERLDVLLKESLQYYKLIVIIALLMLLVAIIHMGWNYALHAKLFL